MTDCASFPNDLVCLQSDEPPMRMDEDDMMNMEASMDMKRAQYAYLFTAAAASSYSGLNLFRYHAADDFYDSGDKLDYNWWKLSDRVYDYSVLTIFGVLALTQASSMFGVSVTSNLLAWMYGGLSFDIFVGLISTLIIMYSYEAYWSCGDDGDSTCAGVAGILRSQIVKWSVMSSAITFSFAMYYENWMMGQFTMMTQEEKEAWMADREAQR